MQKVQGFTEAGNTTLTITGAAGTITRKVQGSFPSCTVTVYLAGTVTLATIYSDNASPPTAKANPFTAASDGSWYFYVADGVYDIKFSGGGLAAPFTIGGVQAFDTMRPDLVRNAATFPGATVSAKIAAACADLPATGGVVDARGLEGGVWSSPVPILVNTLILLGAGTYVVSGGNAFTHTAGNLRVVGLSLGETFITLSGSGRWNFDPAYQTYGIGFSDMEITATSTTQNAVIVGTATIGLTAWVDIHNVRILGPGAGAGTAHGLVVNGMRNSHFAHMWIELFPGDGLRMNGDIGAENRFTQVFIDSVGDRLVHIFRATTTQLGGWYFIDCVVSNQFSIVTCKGVYVLCAAGVQAGLNFMWINGGTDNILGGDCLHFENTGHIQISGGQHDNEAAAGTNPSLNGGVNCFSAAYFFNCNDVSIDGSILISKSRCISLWDVNFFYNLDGIRMIGGGAAAGTVGIFIETGSLTKGLIDVSNISILEGVTTGLAMLTNEYTDLAGLRSSTLTGFPDRCGWFISGTFQISAFAGTGTAGANPHKFWRVESGNLNLYASNNSTNMFRITNAGEVAMGVLNNRTGDLYVGKDQARATEALDSASTVATDSPLLVMYRSRATQATRSGATGDVVAGDRLLNIAAYAWSAGFMATAEIIISVSGAVVSRQRPGSQIDFYTNIANGAQTLNMTLESTGLLAAKAFGIKGGAQGADFNGAITNLTVVKGIVTAAS